MSAETLRRAAALMRDRTIGTTAAPWRTRQSANSKTHDVGVVGPGTYRNMVYSRNGLGVRPHRDAEHIASWHPAVALAVADWLDETAGWVERYERGGEDPHWIALNFQRPLTLASTYLGETS